jgi:nicotianamine synthase
LLNKFPYKQNYIDLSRIECLTIEAFLPTESLSHRPSPKKFAFIGSGPLPLTSLCILDIYPEAVVHNVDRDLPALQVSQELCDRLGYSKRMSFACEDVSMTNKEQVCQDGGSGLRSTYTDWESFDVVFLAALVGMDTQSKLEILTSLGQRLKPGTLVVARSAQGLRAVLYPVSHFGQHTLWIVQLILIDIGDLGVPGGNGARDAGRSTSVDQSSKLSHRSESDVARG